MRRNNQKDPNDNIVETQVAKSDNLVNGNYSATAQLSRYRDTDAFKGGNLLYFSIKNNSEDREVAFYTNGKLSYDTSDKNAVPAIKELEHSFDKTLEDPDNWAHTTRDDIFGKKYDPDHSKNKRDDPWQTVKATAQNFEPPEISPSSSKGQMNDNFLKAASTQNKSRLGDRIEKAKTESEQHKPGHTKDRSFDRER